MHLKCNKITSFIPLTGFLLLTEESIVKESVERECQLKLYHIYSSNIRCDLSHLPRTAPVKICSTISCCMSMVFNVHMY